jgi:hypothetical protein
MISMSNDLPNEYACEVERRVRETLSWYVRTAGWNANWRVRLSPLAGSEFLVTLSTVGLPVVSCAFHAPDEPVEETLRAALEE